MAQQANSSVTGGDRDVDVYRAGVGGEEAVGGTAPVPGQNDSDKLAAAVGIEVPNETPLHLRKMMKERDQNRWELQQESAADLQS